MKNITIRDVAQRAGVSISSVSRYLHNPESINPISAVAVRDAIKALSYVPNPFAQNLKRENSKLIGILVPDISHQFFATACRALELLFHQNNYLVLICDTADDPEKERHYIEELLKNRVAGILLATSGQNLEYLQRLVPENPNIMLFDRLEASLPANVVCENNEQGGYDLAMRMFAKGHHALSVFAGMYYSANTMLRLAGIRRACAQEGVVLEEKYIYQNITERAQAEKALVSLLADEHAPRCVITCNPRLTDALVILINKLSKTAPVPLALAGFTLDDPREIYAFPVCAMRQNAHMVGMKAGEMMLKMLRADDKGKARKTKKILLPLTLID